MPDVLPTANSIASTGSLACVLQIVPLVCGHRFSEADQRPPRRCANGPICAGVVDGVVHGLRTRSDPRAASDPRGACFITDITYPEMIEIAVARTVELPERPMTVGMWSTVGNCLEPCQAEVYLVEFHEPWCVFR
jgi:hypothetical protein